MQSYRLSSRVNLDATTEQKKERKRPAESTSSERFLSKQRGRWLDAADTLQG